MISTLPINYKNYQREYLEIQLDIVHPLPLTYLFHVKKPSQSKYFMTIARKFINKTMTDDDINNKTLLIPPKQQQNIDAYKNFRRIFSR